MNDYSLETLSVGLFAWLLKSEFKAQNVEYKAFFKGRISLKYLFPVALITF